MHARKTLIQKIVSFLSEHGAKRIAIFGSYARGEATPKSDVDVLVKFSERKSLLELVRLERELSEKIGVKAELLTEKSISPYLIKSIKKEAEVVYG